MSTNSHVWRACSLLALLALFLAPLGSTVWAGPVQLTPENAPVDQDVRNQIKSQGSADFWVVMETQADLSSAETMGNWTVRGQYVVDRLQTVASETQPGVIAVLAKAGADYKPYWMVNAIWANGDNALVNELSALPEVRRIAADRSIALPEPIPAPEESQVNAVEWNIDRINAPAVWSTFGDTGQGVVVANIDSGVQFDHPALAGQYRGNLGGGNFDHNYNWFDPSNICGNPSLEPCDNNGHGTHTMGTMVGDDGGANQIGVAPGARFIMAKGCETNSCSSEALLASAQWILAPTDLSGANPRPDLRPHVVNNSWGGGGGDFWYQGMVQAWVASGIFPAFSIGNAGPDCGTAGSPGDYTESYAAGAFDINNDIAYFSSRGPAYDTGITKPNIAAPGVSVRSSFPTDTYISMDGTSMASPHVAGTVALMWSAAPALLGDIDQTRQILDQTAIDTEDLQCGGTVEYNNVWGEGKLDAFSAVEQSPRGPVGVLQGTVTDAGTGLPVADAVVQAVGSITRTTTTDSAGFYSFPILLTGNYDVTVSKFGYQTQTVNGVVVAEGATTVQDIALSPAVMVTVEGRVTDGSAHPGMPLYARLGISGYPYTPVFTDPATGYYSLELPEGETFTFNVSAMSPGYNTRTRDITPAVGGSVANFTLTVDEIACVAPGYELVMDFTVNEDFEADDGGFTASGSTTWQWGTVTYGPPGAYSGEKAWATNPQGNYNDYEDGQTTSPPVNLSTFAGEGIAVQWWQWLQTEQNFDYGSVEVSNDGGANWATIYGPVTGDIDLDWKEYTVILDSSYAVSDFQVRFRFWSDGSVTYPGYYVDDVRIGSATCVPLDGGLVVGYVYDANTGEEVVRATIASDDNPDDSTQSFATPDDPNLEDGFYVLFSSSIGVHPYTATASDYGSDTQEVTVVVNRTVSQDFNLPAGLVAADPTALEVTLDMGETTTETFTLTNSGDQAASFELKERDAGMTPASQPGAPTVRRSGHFTPYRLNAGPKPAIEEKRSIPLDSPPWVDIADYPTAIMDNAADVFDGKMYSVGGYDGGMNTNAAYVYDPASNAWSPVASMAYVREKPAAAFVDEKLYVVGGWSDFGDPVAALEIYDPATNSWSEGTPVPTAYAAATAVSFEDQLYVIGGCDAGFCGYTDVFRYDPAADTWTSLAPYPEPVSWQACGVIGDQIYCAGGISDALGESLHTYVYDPGADMWSQLADMLQTQWGMGYVAANDLLYISGGVTDNFATVTNETFAYDPATDTWSPDANSNNTVYRGGSACGFYKIGGSTTGFNPIPNSEVYPGLDDCGGITDVPWLSEAPVDGTLPASGGSQEIEVTFDASVPEVSQPGAYQAQLRVTTDTPYDVEPVQVTMNINPPANWGKLTGTVNGLALCDLPGAPLADATLEIVGVISLKSEHDGTYTYWLDQGDYTLNVSASGYVTQSLALSVVAGGITTTDFDLRLDAPCASTSPDSFENSVPEGGSDSDTLEIANAGAGELSFNILETVYDLTLPPVVELPAPGDREYALPAVEGPVSVLSYAGERQPVGEAPEAPDSGWFGGFSLPGGIVRYASAQCYEQPDSFYVISGVDGNFNISDKTWRYDAAANEWTELAPIPAGQEGPTAVCYLGKIYAMGGGGTDQFYIYDIATDSWSAGAPLPRGSAGAAAGAWNGKVYLIGGDDDFYPGSGVSDQVDIYDIATDTWVGNGATMPVGTSFPGAVQAGLYMYVAGGWGIDAPVANVSATMRYDMANDVWESGPAFNSARADFALAVTNQALYAIAGDEDGGSFFEPTDLFERLDLASWPEGAWMDTGDPLPIQVSSNNAGFCAESILGSAVWSVGGSDSNTGVIYGSTLFNAVEGETCYSIYSDVSWLAEDPQAGLVPGDTTQPVTVTFDAAGLATGVYQAGLVVVTDDPSQALFQVPVTLTVGEPSADLSLSLEAAPAVVKPGDKLAYVFKVNNSGPSAATGVHLSASLPAGLELILVIPSQGSCTELPCDLGSIEMGASAEVGVVVLVLPGVSHPLVFSGEVIAGTADPAPENNMASVETSVFYWLFLDRMIKD